MESQNATESQDANSVSPTGSNGTNETINKLTRRVQELEKILANVMNYVSKSRGSPNCGCPVCAARKYIETL